MLTLNQLKNEILESALTQWEINTLYAVLKHKNDEIARHATVNFNVGDQVKFKGRGGKYVFGTVEKINSKNIKVRTVDSLLNNRNVVWNVTASLLERNS